MNNFAEIKIGEKSCIVDADMLPFLSLYSWHIRKSLMTDYAATSMRIGKKRTVVLMHRLLTGMSIKIVDHINGNGLDNRLSNIRLCTNAQNSSNMRNKKRKNSLGYRGVKRVVRSDLYGVQISKNFKKYTKTGFKTPEEAARYYDKLSKELHGEFGVRNFED